MVGRSTTANGILSVARRFVGRSDSGEDGVENCSHCSGLEAREVLFKLSLSRPKLCSRSNPILQQNLLH